MPSLDIVSRVDLQEIDNAVNNTLKEIATRYDFRGSKTSVAYDRKEKKITIGTEDQMKMDAVREMFLAKAAKRNLDMKSFEFGQPEPAAGATLRCVVKVSEGLEQDTSKQIVRIIKDSKLKVQASIQGEEVRVSGKQIDDLQAVMTLLRAQNLPVPLQFVNMKR